VIKRGEIPAGGYPDFIGVRNDKGIFERLFIGDQ
jgi:hypothetical protein